MAIVPLKECNTPTLIGSFSSALSTWDPTNIPIPRITATVSTILWVLRKKFTPKKDGIFLLFVLLNILFLLLITKGTIELTSLSLLYSDVSIEYIFKDTSCIS